MTTAIQNLAMRQCIIAAVEELRDELGAELLPVVVSSLSVEAYAKLTELTTKVASRDLHGARQIAHTLAGLMAQFGAAEAFATANRTAVATSLTGIRSEIAALSAQCQDALHVILCEMSRAK